MSRVLPYVTLVLGLAVLPGFPGVAPACDDHVGKCELDAWRARYAESMGTIFLDGSATCDRGRIIIRMYDGDKFLGVLSRHINGHAFRGTADVAAYSDLRIKYSIDPR